MLGDLALVGLEEEPPPAVGQSRGGERDIEDGGG